MLCPKCDYISFDHVTTCSKCNADLAAVASVLNGTTAFVEENFFLGSVVKSGDAETQDFSAGDTGEEFTVDAEAGEADIDAAVEEIGAGETDEEVPSVDLADIEADNDVVEEEVVGGAGLEVPEIHIDQVASEEHESIDAVEEELGGIDLFSEIEAESQEEISETEAEQVDYGSGQQEETASDDEALPEIELEFDVEDDDVVSDQLGSDSLTEESEGVSGEVELTAAAEEDAMEEVPPKAAADDSGVVDSDEAVVADGGEEIKDEIVLDMAALSLETEDTDDVEGVEAEEEELPADAGKDRSEQLGIDLEHIDLSDLVHASDNESDEELSDEDAGRGEDIEATTDKDSSFDLTLETKEDSVQGELELESEDSMELSDSDDSQIVDLDLSEDDIDAFDQGDGLGPIDLSMSEEGLEKLSQEEAEEEDQPLSSDKGLGDLDLKLEKDA